MTTNNSHFSQEDTLSSIMSKYAMQPKINFKSLKLNFAGPPRAGKTTTKLRTLDQLENLSSFGNKPMPSTHLEKSVAVELFERSEIASVSIGSQWKEKNLLGEMQLFVHRVHKVPDEPASQGATKQVQETEQSGASLTTTPSSEHPMKEDNHDEDISRIIQEVLGARGLENLEQIEDTVTAYIMDTGGQPEFHELLPLVLRGPALHLIFFNMAHDLDDTIHIRYCEKGGSYSDISYDAYYTTKKVLYQLLSSLYCLSKLCRSSSKTSFFTPTAILIGTHADLAKESVEAISEKLKVFFSECGFFQEDFLRYPGNGPIFIPLDNQNGTAHEVHKLRGFLQTIIQQRFHPVPLPSSWALLHLVLRHK